MKIAIASGKGGTGKTTVSSSLAMAWSRPIIAVDLDVEEPNLHLFLKPDIHNEEKAYIVVPIVDEHKCNLCRACTEICQFKAISLLKDVLLVYSEMCHGCGGCFAVCQQNALFPDKRELGDILWGAAGSADFLMGRLRVGEAMSPPLMRKVKTQLNRMLQDLDADVIIDAPPGVSCPAVNAVMDADVIVLVTEPTPFGRYDLKLAIEAFTPMGKPMGVVINRAGIGDDAIYGFCRDKNIPIWAEIPFQHDIAVAYANGQIVADISPQLSSLFVELAKAITQISAADREACNA